MLYLCKQKDPELSPTASLFCKQPQQTLSEGRGQPCTEELWRSHLGGSQHISGNSNTAETRSSHAPRNCKGGLTPKENESPAALLPAQLLPAPGAVLLSQSPGLHPELQSTERQQLWDGSLLQSFAPGAICCGDSGYEELFKSPE